MTVQECYQKMGSDYNEVISRLGTDTRIAKFAKRFVSDDNYQKLSAAMESGDVKEAFLAAHTLKGVCKNLAFSKLGKASEEITETLRAGDFEASKPFLPAVKEAYRETIDAINLLD